MKMYSPIKLGLAAAAFLPAALACLAYEGGVPVPTAHHSNSNYIEVKAGETFDGLWAKYDRGSGACGGDSEGGM